LFFFRAALPFFSFGTNKFLFPLPVLIAAPSPQQVNAFSSPRLDKPFLFGGHRLCVSGFFTISRVPNAERPGATDGPPVGFFDFLLHSLSPPASAGTPSSEVSVNIFPSPVVSPGGSPLSGAQFLSAQQVLRHSRL